MEALIYSLITDIPQSFNEIEAQTEYSRAPVRKWIHKFYDDGKVDYITGTSDSGQKCMLWFRCDVQVKREPVVTLEHLVMSKPWDRDIFVR